MKKYAKYMALAVTLALLGLVFYFSAQPGAVSYKVSETVMNTVQSGKAKAITPQWFSTTNLNVNVRKWAHEARIKKTTLLNYLGGSKAAYTSSISTGIGDNGQTIYVEFQREYI